ncbi:cytochrome c-type biogenesis protein CcmH [Bacillus shivajii]|uniref:cytochrome c-type biogenesis protein n=1 Tax=Bacillus shivajii TaxID=1983719 RepID=UPI001CF970CD|nr:cytochrome c-type biogenesis protein [Bacillus shivajii]UCZ52500.1 cytochrome c-type biogenesis protein CcmH [Bacillus shivajii]
MVKRTLIIVLFFLVASFPVMANGEVEVYDYNSPEFRDTAKQLQCLCGCGQDHFECNMDGCGLNDAFKQEIVERLNEGETDEEIVNYYLNLYGEEILTAPEKRGFSLTAWITPFATLGVASAGLIMLIRRWVNKSKKEASMIEEVEPERSEEDELEEEILRSMIDQERKKDY